MLVTSLFIGIVGFSIAFIANANQSTPGFVDTSNVSNSPSHLKIDTVTYHFYAQLTSLAHFGIGVLLMVLQIVNVCYTL